MAITFSTAEAQDKFSEIINRVTHDKEQIILTRRGKDIAAIIPLEDLLLLQNIHNKHDLQEALEALKEAREKGSIDLDKIKTEVGA